MLVEYKIKEFDKLIITDFNADIINTANNYIKKNIFIKDNLPENYIITISREYYNRSKLSFLNTENNTIYYFNFNVVIINDNKEIFGNMKIDSNGMLREYNTVFTNNENESIIDPVIMDLIDKRKDNYCLDINSKNSVTINDGLLKFYDDEAKISVIQDLKNKNKFSNKENI